MSSAPQLLWYFLTDTVAQCGLLLLLQPNPACGEQIIGGTEKKSNKHRKDICHSLYLLFTF